MWDISPSRILRSGAVEPLLVYHAHFALGRSGGRAVPAGHVRERVVLVCHDPSTLLLAQPERKP